MHHTAIILHEKWYKFSKLNKLNVYSPSKLAF